MDISYTWPGAGNEARIIQADSLEYLEREAMEHPAWFDCIWTDMPYWTLDKWRKIGTTTRLGGNRKEENRRDEMWFETINEEQVYHVLSAFDNLLKPNNHAYLMCDHEVMPILLSWIRQGEIAFNYSKPIVWDKIDNGMGYHWRASHEYIVDVSLDTLIEQLEHELEAIEEGENERDAEFILMLEKGKRRLNDLSRPDVLHYKRVQGKHYPTEKPYGLVEELILNSTKEGDWILDPFCGSGVLGEVCLRNNRNCVLIDKNPAAIEWTVKRLDGVLHPTVEKTRSGKTKSAQQSELF